MQTAACHVPRAIQTSTRRHSQEPSFDSRVLGIVSVLITYNNIETLKGTYHTKGTEHLNAYNFTISHHYLIQLQFLSYTYQYEERSDAIGCLCEPFTFRLHVYMAVTVMPVGEERSGTIGCLD